MQTEPYSIVTDGRPFRIAFLCRISGSDNRIDEIIDYNRNLWGGRFNPIILTDGESIRTDWWSLLKSHDPDLIVTTLPLSSQIRQRIQTFLSPLKVEEVRDDDAV